MSEIAGWVAPAATMIAAMMTAANLGARITGWGFVVFAVGSVAWIIVAVTSHQSNLLLTNGFLTLVNIVGIWRWLGRRAKYDEGAHVAEEASADAPSSTLFQLGGMEGKPVIDERGETAGHVVDVMAECQTGRISYFVVREGSELSLSETLRVLSWHDVRVTENELRLNLGDLRDATEIKPDAWPVKVPAMSPPAA